MLAADRPARRERERVGAGHDQLPVGEVDEPQDAEDEPDPDRHQRVDGAEPDRVDERLGVDGGDGSGRRGTPRSACRCRPRRPGVSVMPQLAVRQHVRAVGERDRALRALLDEQDGDAAVADRGQGGEDRVDHRRREPERRLVEQEHVGAGDERAADRELLLLAAGERAGRPAARLARAPGRARRPPRAASPPLAAAAAESPSRRFSSTVSSPKIRRPSGTSETPGAGDRLGRPAAERRAREPHVAARRPGRRP